MLQIERMKTVLTPTELSSQPHMPTSQSRMPTIQSKQRQRREPGGQGSGEDVEGEARVRIELNHVGPGGVAGHAKPLILARIACQGRDQTQSDGGGERGERDGRGGVKRGVAT